MSFEIDYASQSSEDLVDTMLDNPCFWNKPPPPDWLPAGISREFDYVRAVLAQRHTNEEITDLCMKVLGDRPRRCE